MRHLRRQGRYFRVASPSWTNPLDASHSQRHGGRWNAPGSFPVLYLNGSEATARANVRRKFAGRPYGGVNLDPTAAPDLIDVDVPATELVDVVTDQGIAEVGLPRTYPVDGDGTPVPHEATRPIGRRAWDAGESGIAARSAAPGADRSDEELALFDRGLDLAPARRRTFSQWWGR